MLDVLETFLYGSRDQKTHQPPAYEASAALAAGRPRVRGSAQKQSAAHCSATGALVGPGTAVTRRSRARRDDACCPASRAGQEASRGSTELRGSPTSPHR